MSIKVTSGAGESMAQILFVCVLGSFGPSGKDEGTYIRTHAHTYGSTAGMWETGRSAYYLVPIFILGWFGGSMCVVGFGLGFG